MLLLCIVVLVFKQTKHINQYSKKMSSRSGIGALKRVRQFISCTVERTNKAFNRTSFSTL